MLDMLQALHVLLDRLACLLLCSSFLVFQSLGGGTTAGVSCLWMQNQSDAFMTAAAHKHTASQMERAHTEASCGVLIARAHAEAIFYHLHNVLIRMRPNAFLDRQRPV